MHHIRASFSTGSYTFSTAQPHAVTAAFGNSYGYDANGNQTGRTIGSTAYTQVFDYENRLVEVKQGSTTIGAFVYDAGGSRVVGTVNGTTTVYIAGLFEYQGGAMTSYYAGVSGPVALRRTGYASNNGIFYMLDDHLNSTGVILNQNGTVSTQHYYYPFGGNRGGAFSPITTKRFTGQYHEAGLPGGEGLSYYNARWYDGQLGRFISADTIVPNPGNPQSLNRLSYVRNNPLRYTDPTGRRECGHDCNQPLPYSPEDLLEDQIRRRYNNYGVTFTVDPGKNWTERQKVDILKAARATDRRLRYSGVYGPIGYSFTKAHGYLTAHRSAKMHYMKEGVLKEIDFGAQTFGRVIEFYDAASFSYLNFRNNAVHEFGHAFNNRVNTLSTHDPYDRLGTALGSVLPSRESFRLGMKSYPWQQNTREEKNENFELFADGYLNWVFSSFINNSTEGEDTIGWFNDNVPLWVSSINP